MAEETRLPGQNSGAKGDAVKGDFSTILVGVGAIIDSTMEPVSKILSMTLDSLSVVAKQVLDGVNSTLGNK